MKTRALSPTLYASWLRLRSHLRRWPPAVTIILVVVILFSGKARPEVLPTGAFEKQIPILVPAYHGLEPRLAFTYRSDAGNGWLGVGWTLSGLSVIERRSSGRGTPTFTKDDVFYLDGAELIPCQKSTVSPSCMLLASQSFDAFTGRVETFERISFDHTADDGRGIWFVWRKDGVKTTYVAIPSLTFMGKAVDWYVRSVEDPNGNRVDYNYTPDNLPYPGPNYWQAYPYRIKYNGNEGHFFSELRPDQETAAIGYFFRTTRYRLQNVDVIVRKQR